MYADKTLLPLYIHTFRYLAPHSIKESEKYNFIDPKNIETVSDKLKYYRYKNNLKQSEVAEYLGICRGVYSGYEENSQDYYPIENMTKIAKLFKIETSALLDDYNKFIYSGQANNLTAIQNNLNLTTVKFASLLNIIPEQLHKWQKNKSRISKAQYQNLMKKTTPKP